MTPNNNVLIKLVQWQLGENIVKKSMKQFGHNFTSDAQTIWSELPDDVVVASSVCLL